MSILVATLALIALSTKSCIAIGSKEAKKRIEKKPETWTGISTKSPYHQGPPDCTQPHLAEEPFPVKRTSLKGIVCPMVKDEQGFLSEFVAFYEMQGIHHVKFYDSSTGNSSLSSFEEVQLWIDAGFVSIEREWWLSPCINVTWYGNMTSKPTDHLNHLAGVHCRQQAYKMNVDIFFSLDIDEYLMPLGNGNLMDDVVEWMVSTNLCCNFNRHCMMSIPLYCK